MFMNVKQLVLEIWMFVKHVFGDIFIMDVMNILIVYQKNNFLKKIWVKVFSMNGGP